MPRAPILAFLVCMVLAAPAAASDREVPPGFLGMMADGPLAAPGFDLGGEFGVMSSTGVEAVRFSIYWNQAQPLGEDSTDFTATDRYVAAAASGRLRLLPVVLRAPAWARRHPRLANSPPSAAGVGAYGRFLCALIARYGPQGSFWAEHPELPRAPIRRWQVWNEPDGVRDWSDRPGIGGYVRLLRRAHDAIRAADPGAQVVLAGLVGRSWEHLTAVYRRGGRRYFDAVAIHPFSREVPDVMRILRRGRSTMRRNGDDRKPMLVTELSWPSAKNKTSLTYGFEVTERGQAERLRSAIRAIAGARRSLRIAGVYWSTWMSYDRDPVYPFDYAGVRRRTGEGAVNKPAFYAFRKIARRLEGR